MKRVVLLLATILPSFAMADDLTKLVKPYSICLAHSNAPIVIPSVLFDAQVSGMICINPENTGNGRFKCSSWRPYVYESGYSDYCPVIVTRYETLKYEEMRKEADDKKRKEEEAKKEADIRDMEAVKSMYIELTQ